MTKLLMRCLVALSTVLVLSCGGGGGGGSVDGASAGVSTSTTNAIKDASSPEWGFSAQAGASEGGGNGGSASGSSSGTSGSSASGGSSSGSSSGDTASASAGDTGGVGSGGTGASASAGDSGDSGVGVGGVASIIVNDVRYDTTGAILKLRDASQLQLGMTAKVNGPTNADFTAGQATEVESAADARGVITSIDLGNGNLVVLGMTITTDATTVWGNVSGLGALAPGMTVQVWGLPAGPGLLRATRIEQVAAGTPILSGVVQNLDLANRRFLLGGLTIDFSQTTLPPAAVGGVNVRVRASAAPSAGLLQASAVELWYPVSLRDGTRRQLGGVVTDFSAITSFRILGTPVNASSAQVSGGPAAAIGNGVELDVAGTVSNGVLVATKIRIKKTPGGANTASFTAKGTVGAFKSVAEFKVKGQAVDASGAQFVNGTAAGLGNGTKVSIAGARIVNDVLIATQVTFD
jgi:hypothetical protein